MASWFTIVLVTGLLCLSCQLGARKPIATTPFHGETKNNLNYQDANMLSTDSTLGLPDNLKSIQPLWEVYQASTPNKPASISRVYENGQIYNWSNTRRVAINGKVSREPAPYAWRLDAQIRPEGVDRLRELIKAEFVKLPSNNSVSTGSDQGYVVWQSHLDRTDYRVTLPTSASINLPQVIRDIDYTIQSNIIPGAVPLTQ